MLIVGRILKPRSSLAKLACAIVVTALFVMVPRMAFSQGLASYSSVATNSANFTAGAVTGTIAISNRTNVTSASGLLTTTPPSGSNFPGSWYSPSTPALTNFQRYELSNSNGTSTGSYTVTYTFDTPATNPIFYFYNVDAGTYDFSSTTQTDGSAVSLTKLSGNNELELSGTVVNSTPRTASNTGCEANNGSNGQGGCGSIQLSGTYQTVTFVGTDTTLDNATGDGHGIALFVQSDYGDAPSTYGSAAHSGNTSIRLGALRDVESANQPSTGATLDDTTGSDDEDALASVTGVTLTGGATHTQSGISCTGTGSLYGYIDFNRDGDFADSNEQSALSACSGGTASLSWTLPSATGSLVAGASFLRIRYASDSTQISSPSGNATTGEVEDYPITLTNPSADLAVTKTDGVSSIASGASTTYTVTVTNNGPSTVTGAVLTDAAVSSMTKTAVACGSPAGQCTAGTTPTIAQLEAGYALPALTSGQAYYLTVTATVTATSGSAVNSATIAVPSGVTDSSSANNSASDSDTITARVAGTAPTLSCSAGTTVHNWDAMSWTAGSTNNNYSVSSIGTVNFSITKSGGTWMNLAALGGQNPALQSTSIGGLAAAELSLSHYIDFTSTSDTATTTITLPTAVPGAQFKIFDVDYGASAFADKITVTGSFNGSSVTPTLTNGTANYVIGNTAYGDTVSSDTSSAGNVTVTFSAPVDTITITYGSNSLAPSNPTGQSYFLHDMTLCKPVADIGVTKVSSVISDPVNGTTNAKAIPGAVMEYCILIANNGTSTLTSISASDTLPANFTYATGTMTSGTSCAAATTAEDDNSSGTDESDPYGAAISGTSLSATAATLGSSSSFALKFRGTVN